MTCSLGDVLMSRDRNLQLPCWCFPQKGQQAGQKMNLLLQADLFSLMAFWWVMLYLRMGRLNRKHCIPATKGLSGNRKHVYFLCILGTPKSASSRQRCWCLLVFHPVPFPISTAAATRPSRHSRLPFLALLLSSWDCPNWPTVLWAVVFIYLFLSIFHPPHSTFRLCCIGVKPQFSVEVLHFSSASIGLDSVLYSVTQRT